MSTKTKATTTSSAQTSTTTQSTKTSQDSFVGKFVYFFILNLNLTRLKTISKDLLQLEVKSTISFCQ